MPRIRKRLPIAIRFWRRVTVGGGDECWIWNGPKNKGYGRFKMRGADGKLITYAHRAAWTLTNGPIPDGLDVLHRCDNPSCVNVAHLFTGTHTDNMDDMTQKGRRAITCGEIHPNAKITATIATAIRADPRVSRIVASEYGISPELVRAVRCKRLWAHI